jgi:transposase
MAASACELPDDLQSCHELIKQLRRDLQTATERNTQLESAAAEAHEATTRITFLEDLVAEQQQTIHGLERKIGTLNGDIRLLQRALYGSRRERYIDPSQQFLFNLKLIEQPSPQDGQEPPPPGERRRTSRGRRPRVFPEFLPREEKHHRLQPEDIPPELRDHPDARRFFKKVGESLEIIPMQMKVIEHLQEVIALDQPDATTLVISANRPQPLIRSFAGPSLWAWLTVSRFGDHLPYYRLEDILGRSGFRIDRSTQWRWMRGLAEGATPLVDLMWDLARQSSVLGMDETPVRVLSDPGGKRNGYLWVGVGDRAHPYDCLFYTPDRRGLRPEALLTGFQGYLVADAYTAYERLGKLWPGISKASCWAHARRKFEACHHLGPTLTTSTALSYFQQLYSIEELLCAGSDEDRLAVRREKSRPIVESFQAWLQEEQTRQLPKSKLLGAINYMLHRWESFTRFLESGAIPIDNNAAERAVKYPVLGRKAWLFFGNQTAGETAAKLFTLTKTCNRLRIDPFAYLQDVYARLPTTLPRQLPSLLPDRWIQEHPQHLIQERVHEALDRAQRARERRAERRQRAA